MEKLWTDNSALQTVTTFSKEKHHGLGNV